VQTGAIKLPSWLPCRPKTLLAVAPGAGNCQPQQLVNWNEVPGLAPVRVPTFHWLVIVTCSGKASVTVQLLIAVVRVLVTDTSVWKKVPPVFEGVTVQATPPLDELELLELDELEELDELLEDEELELLLDEELLDDELEELELLLDELDEELEELELLDDVPELEDELLDDELELDELELDELELPPLIVPVEAVRVTRSSRAPSSRRLIRSV
jgi:hypothetical protein